MFSLLCARLAGHQVSKHCTATSRATAGCTAASRTHCFAPSCLQGPAHRSRAPLHPAPQCLTSSPPLGPRALASWRAGAPALNYVCRRRLKVGAECGCSSCCCCCYLLLTAAAEWVAAWALNSASPRSVCCTALLPQATSPLPIHSCCCRCCWLVLLPLRAAAHQVLQPALPVLPAAALLDATPHPHCSSRARRHMRASGVYLPMQSSQLPAGGATVKQLSAKLQLQRKALDRIQKGMHVSTAAAAARTWPCAHCKYNQHTNLSCLSVQLLSTHELPAACRSW